MTTGRVFRSVDGRWSPIGDPLPTWDHVPPRPQQPTAVWVLPRDQGYEPGDVVAFGEVGHRLVARVPAGDPAWAEIATQASATADLAHVREWLAGVELWLGMKLSGGNPLAQP